MYNITFTFAQQSFGDWITALSFFTSLGIHKEASKDGFTLPTASVWLVLTYVVYLSWISGGIVGCWCGIWLSLFFFKFPDCCRCTLSDCVFCYWVSPVSTAAPPTCSSNLLIVRDSQSEDCWPKEGGLKERAKKRTCFSEWISSFFFPMSGCHLYFARCTHHWCPDLSQNHWLRWCWRWCHHYSVGFCGLRCLLSLHVIPHWLCDVEMRAPWRLYHLLFFLRCLDIYKQHLPPHFVAVFKCWS